jgi:diaminopimelate decarboxylase
MTTHNSERVGERLGGCDASTLAAEFGTPLLAIDEVWLRARMQRFRAAFEREGRDACVTYAGKALLIAAIARIANEEGLYVDVCSLGELETALRGGVPAERCIVHGCYKTRDELAAAVHHGVRHVVIDHESEIAALADLARDASRRVDVLLRLNPSIAARTHELIQTAAPASKFGFSLADTQAIDAVRATLARKELRLSGIHCHLGSQIHELQAYADAIDVMISFSEIAHRQTGVRFEIVDVGGGLAVGDADGRAEPSPEAWADALFAALDRRLAGSPLGRPRLYVEPGRSLVASAGTTLYRIGVRKRLPDGRDALIVDGGMSDNPRPALYGARYGVSIVGRESDAPTGSFTIFGRHCETDRLFPDVELPDPREGEFLAVADTGAYTYAMASNYNRFVRPAVILASSGSARVIARRESLDRVLDLDVAEDA